MGTSADSGMSGRAWVACAASVTLEARLSARRQRGDLGRQVDTSGEEGEQGDLLDGTCARSRETDNKGDGNGGEEQQHKHSREAHQRDHSLKVPLGGVSRKI